MSEIENILYGIRQKQDYKQVPELRKRKHFRLWKIGEQLKNDQDWWNVTLFVASLIFDNAEPRPISVGILWIKKEAYYDEGWVTGVTWKDTAYEEYRELCKAARDGEKAWLKLQKKADIITDFEMPKDVKARLFFVRAAKLHMEEYKKRRLIVNNLHGILRFIEQEKRLPTPEEWQLK